MFRRALRTSPSHDRRWVKRLGPLSLVLALVAVLAPSTLIPAGAADATESFTIEGCRNNGSISLPNTDGDFICADSAYTPGNLGKGWNELDLVPFRVTATGGTSTAGTFSIVLDYQDAGKPGYDVISAPVLNEDLSDASCTEPSSTGQLQLQPGLGGADISIYREVTITQAPGSTCVYDYYGRLALGSHRYPGSSLHANLANENQTTAGIGSKEISIPVREIKPQELRKTMTASQGSDYIWNVTKEASPTNLTFDQTCTSSTSPTLQQPVEITVTWTRSAATASGDITVVTNVYAKNPASRTITVDVTDRIYTGTTLLYTLESDAVDVLRNSEALVASHTFTVPAGTTSLNDIATATYTDLVTGIAVPGTTTAAASAEVVTSSAVTNATATITDVESISGDGFSFSVASPSIGTFTGVYTAGTRTSGSVGWTSGSQSGSGSITFAKTVYATAGVVGSGSLSDTATLTGSNGSTATASAAVGLSATARVTLNINKTIPDVLTGDETVSFDFQVFNNADDVLLGTRTIAFSAGGATSGSASVLDLAPGTYTVHEVPNASGEWGIQEDRSVTIALPSCSGSVSFANTRNTGDLSVVKVTTGGSGTFRFDVDCDRDAYDRMGDDALSITDSGTATVTGIPTGTSCTVTEWGNSLFSSVVIPDNGEVTITSGANIVSFTNTANPIGITLDKKVNGADHATAGDALLAHSGDPLTYTVVITNNGQLPLTITTLADTMVAGFATTCTQGIGSVLAPAASFTCTYTLSADLDATNTASVTGVDGLDRNVTAQDSTFVDVLNPAITIVKTANPVSVSVSGPVTYTYVVTNTGDAVLSNIVVTDDIIGAIGTVASLAPGQSVTLSKTVNVDASTPPTNIGTANGTDVLGKTVTASDSETIAVVLGIVVVQPAVELPRTGSPLGTQARLGLFLLQAGLLLALLGHRRRKLHLQTD